MDSRKFPRLIQPQQSPGEMFTGPLQPRNENMIYVTKINEVNGNLQLAADGASVSQFDTAEQYVEWSAANNALINCGAYDADVADMGDEDGKRLAEAIRTASGAVQGGHKTIIAFLVGDEIQLESIEEHAIDLVDIDEDDSKADLRTVWNVIDTPIYRIVDEEGANTENAQVRRLTDGVWISVDDKDGFSVLNESEVRHLLLVKNEEFEAIV